MSPLSKVKVSPSSCRQLGALADAHGMGHDERARAWADRGSVACCRWQHEHRNSGVRAGGQHAAYSTHGQTVPRGWRGRASTRSAWAFFKQSDQARSARGRHPACAGPLCRFRPDAVGRETAGKARDEGLTRDPSGLDGRGRFVAVAQTASDLSPTAAAARTCRRIDPDRRFGPSLVRRSR